MRQLSNALIYNNEGEILVVDKPSINGTILPGGKLDDGENHEKALKRELFEELGISNITILKILGDVQGNSPTSNKESNIKLYEIHINNKKFFTNSEIKNPRYLSYTVILDLKTTTELTKKVIHYLINKSLGN